MLGMVQWKNKQNEKNQCHTELDSHQTFIIKTFLIIINYKLK